MEATRAFSFGENWEAYLDADFNAERLASAERHLLGFLGVADLRGKHFLDVGSGSGIHSAAAVRAGARRVVSFDLDPASVRATRRLWSQLGAPAHWQVLEGSVLDRAFLATLDPADIVYSWGVLHHTGRMWEALGNTAPLLKGEGQLYIGLYVTGPKSDYWLEVKRAYNRASAPRRRLMEVWYASRHAILPQLVRLKNPLGLIRNQGRGMTWFTGLRDWLGGYPYEDATPAEVLRHCREQLGLEMTNIHADAGFAEYLFCRRRLEG